MIIKIKPKHIEQSLGLVMTLLGGMVIFTVLLQFSPETWEIVKYYLLETWVGVIIFGFLALNIIFLIIAILLKGLSLIEKVEVKQ